jgi:EAL domain-containing protein (putative c-di-GMP-specific phosphodiesterase class I)
MIADHPTAPTSASPFSWAARRKIAQVRRAIPRGELRLFCQPTVDCRTGALRSAEALIRWQHPSRGLLAPGEWVPTVESSSASTEFNLHVLELALDHSDTWASLGVAVPLSVNVTPECLSDERFVAGVEQMFADRSPAGAIALEVTERATVVGTLAMSEGVARLRGQGFDFLLDDFGAECSSLSRLAGLPFTTLKLDGSLVGQMARDRAHRLISHAAIEMAHALGLDIIAEGVEDVGTWSLLQALGCDLIQGYFISRPIPAAALPRFQRDYQARPPQASRGRSPLPGSGPEPERRAGPDRRSGRDRRDLALSPA